MFGRNNRKNSKTPPSKKMGWRKSNTDKPQTPEQGTTADDNRSPNSEQTSGPPSAVNVPNTTPNTKEPLPQPPKDESASYYRELIAHEKAGKRKLFHSLIKLANELKRVKAENNNNTGTNVYQEHDDYANESWYQGGLWRAPRVLPGVQHQRGKQTRLRGAISLSDLFFNLVIVTAFTRVGVAITTQGRLTAASLLYFAVFWTIWSKAASYSTRFDTSDLSAKLQELVTCFAVLFASLSANQPLNSQGGTRIMIMAAFCAFLHSLLLGRVTVAHWSSTPGTLEHHVRRYALFNVQMNLLEFLTWGFGILVTPENWEHRWTIFLLGFLCGLRIPRAFMANDFHAACSKRGVLFILLLGFMLQSVVVVATEFFEYQTPTLEDYSFIGAACLLLFCIKLLYVEDSSTLTSDHALLVNRTAALFFNLGQFALLLSTTVMGSGLTLLTHSYMAAAAALPDNTKSLVCGGFSAVLFSTFFIKSMHLKRVPTDPQHRALFIGAYIIQGITTLVIVGITAAMSFGHGGYLQTTMDGDVKLLMVLSGFAVFLVAMSWLDEGLELSLFDFAQDSRQYLIHPFGFWWCLRPELNQEDLENIDPARGEQLRHQSESARLSVLSPLLGESLADMKQMEYDALQSEDLSGIDHMSTYL